MAQHENVSPLPIDAEAFVLADGASQRVEPDNALRSGNGTPGNQRLTASLTGLFQSVSTLGSASSVGTRLGLPVIEEASTTQASLWDICTGLESTSTTWNFFLDAGLLLMTETVVRRLARALLMPDGPGKPVAAVVPVTPSGMQLTSAFYSTRALDGLRAAVCEGQSMAAWLDRVRVRNVYFPDNETPFRNVCRREELCKENETQE